MIQIIRTFFQFGRLVGPRFKLSVGFMVVGNVLLGLFDATGILLIYPLVLITGHPDAVHTGPEALRRLYLFFGSPDYLLFASSLSVAVAMLFIAKGLLQALFMRMQFRVASAWRKRIARSMFSGYMAMDYEEFSRKPAAEVVSLVLTTLNQTVDFFVIRTMLLMNYAIAAIIICSAIIYMFPLVMAASVTFVFVVFLVQSRIVKARLLVIGKTIREESVRAMTALQQGLSGYKDTKTHLMEQRIVDRFSETIAKMNDAEERNVYFQNVPIIVVEVALFLLIIGILNAFMFWGGKANPMADMAIIVAAAFRLAPLANRSINCIAVINSVRHATTVLLREADALGIGPQDDRDIRFAQPSQPLAFETALTLENVGYRYPDQARHTLTGISFAIPKGEFLGIVGRSGAGKSTLVNVLIGLMAPTEGRILVDGRTLDEDGRRALLRDIGYVDQAPFVFANTVAANVAYGLDPAEIDYQRVTTCLDMAQMTEVVAAMPQGVHTLIGDSGQGLSGGQRQRLAIARALYKQPKILILDEASSALDVETENRLAECLVALRGQVTIIAIAHRLSTLRDCDRVAYLEDGRLAGVGTIASVSQACPNFRRLVELSEIGDFLPDEAVPPG